jgi:hypothetical protein
MLPNFLIIGSGRCATTWIHGCLSEHPEIFTPTIKELHFFSKHYAKGIDFYARYFDDAEEKLYKAIGEASPTYLAHADSPERIFRHLPHVKLLASLRNPIERAYSMYLLFQRNYGEKSFEEALQTRSNLLTDGLYHQHILKYLEFFPLEQFKFVFYEDIENDPIKFIQDIYLFLGVNEAFIPSLALKKTNLIIYPELQKALYKLKMGWIIDLVKKTPLDRYLRRVGRNKKIIRYPEMKSETRVFLKNFYEESNIKLSLLLGRDLKHWK